jgi:hypothetical protein
MNTQHIPSSKSFTIVVFVLLFSGSSFSQTVTDLRDTTIQADYIIITSGAYVSAAEQLAAFRTSHSALSAKIVIVDSIYHQFNATTTADSAIRDFIRYTLSNWKTPKPNFFLLAGNVNTVPSHKEEGLQLQLDLLEDSIMVDQWFVENTNSTPQYIASIGRFPAWNLAQLQTMVNKTITYQTIQSTAWMNKAIIVADSIEEIPYLFEEISKETAHRMYPLWKDTLIVHIRATSPNYKSTESFRNLWNSGTGVISFVGMANEKQFSRSRYFGMEDVSLLTNGDKLPICLFTAGLRFERLDTTGIVVDLMKSNIGGSVATIAGSGAMYLDEAEQFINFLFSSLATHASMTLGEAMMNGLNIPVSWFERKYTLLGDPALTIRKGPITTVQDHPSIPEKFVLHQNFPNPFNPSTTIQFTLPSEQFVSLKVYNMLGQEVASLVNDIRSQGTHSVTFNAIHLSAGAYVYRLQAGNFSDVKKLMLLK